MEKAGSGIFPNSGKSKSGRLVVHKDDFGALADIIDAQEHLRRSINTRMLIFIGHVLLSIWILVTLSFLERTGILYPTRGEIITYVTSMWCLIVFHLIVLLISFFNYTIMTRELPVSGVPRLIHDVWKS